MKMQKITIALIPFFLLFVQFGTAQSNVQPKNQMYKKRIVRAVDLREKQNKPLYAQDIEFTNLLLEAILSGEITAYTNDSLATTVDVNEIRSKITVGEDIETITDSSEYDYENEPFWEEEEFEQESYSFSGRDLYQLEITQDWIFDNNKSVVNKENVGITLFIPADHPDNIRGIQFPIATLSFHDCINLWADNPKALWFNPYNDASHINLSQAFKLELYHSYIVKVSNPDNNYIIDEFPEQLSIFESHNQENKLMEYESNLWSN